MKNYILTLVMILASVAAISCEKAKPDDDPVGTGELIERKDFVLTRSQMEMVKANNVFALELFSRTAQTAEGQSFLISPLSVTYALGMVDNGAKGKTQEEINSVLGYDESTVEGLNAFCKTMLEQSAQVDPSTTIEIANTAVVNKVIPLLPEFTEKVESNYEAVVTYKDFEKDDVMGFINSWCDQKTHGMIPVLLEDPVDPSTYAHFLNAIYFKGIWSHQFKKADTSKEKFTLEDGSTRKVDMMHQKTTFSVGGGKGYSSIILPYGNQAYRMTVLLPAKGVSVKDVMDGLTVDSLDPKKGFYDVAEVDLKLPVFESEFKTEFSEILCDMGMPTAFSLKADFSAMTTASVCISKVLHKAKIKVDETGSEAAAVTDVSMKYTSAGPDANQPVVFHADHPFIYAITEVSTGAIFFIGQYSGK